VVRTTSSKGDEEKEGWQVIDADVEEKRSQDGSLWDAILEASWPASFVVASGKGDAAITKQLHDQEDHVLVRHRRSQGWV